MTFFLLQNYWLIIPIIVFIAYQTMLWSSRDKNVPWTPSMGQQLVSVLIVLSENPIASRAHHHHRPLRLGMAPERTIRARHPESSGEEFLLGNSPFWSIQKKKKRIITTQTCTLLSKELSPYLSEPWTFWLHGYTHIEVMKASLCFRAPFPADHITYRSPCWGQSSKM